MGTSDEWKEFITAVKHLGDSDLPVHFIFIIRAEYLHFMAELEKELPNIFNNKFRVEKISRGRAAQCVEGPCKLFNIAIEEGFTDRLFDQLSPERNGLELTYLQVFLDRIYKKAEENKNLEDRLVFSNQLLADMGLIGDVLADFLDEQLTDMPHSEIAEQILKAFVTLDGTKRQVSTDEV